MSDPRDADIQIHVGTPYALPKRRARQPDSQFVFYTFAEAPLVSERWVEVLNQCSEVWTPTQFSKDAFVASGVHRPIHLVPLGVECRAEPIARPAPDSGQPFTFMWQGLKLKSFRNGQPHDGDRKCGLLVEQAFRSANLPNTRLILKYLPVEGVGYDFRIDPIWYVCKSLSNTEMESLDALVDAFIWPTMGEGFGLPPLEKLAKGIPAFATYWSGPQEYLRDFKNLRRLQPSSSRTIRFNGVVTKMARVDEAAVVGLMRDCYERRGELHAMREDLLKTAQAWSVERMLKPRLIAAINRLWRERFTKDS